MKPRAASITSASRPDSETFPGWREQFICGERGIACGVYQWTDRASAHRFYSGPWLDGIRQRYGAHPQIEFFKTLAITDNPGGGGGSFGGSITRPGFLLP